MDPTEEFELDTCTVCLERWPVTYINDSICPRCERGDWDPHIDTYVTKKEATP